MRRRTPIEIAVDAFKGIPAPATDEAASARVDALTDCYELLSASERKFFRWLMEREDRRMPKAESNGAQPSLDLVEGGE